MAAALLILASLLVRTPSPEYFLMDPDGGVQLAAAQQIRLTGEQPWIDFYVPYGPLVYYLSFLGQWASGSNGGRVWNCARCTLLHTPEVAAYLKKYPEASRGELVHLSKKRQARG